MTQKLELPFSKAVDDAVRRLVSVQHFHAGSLVSMPMVYPSGASVVLELSSQAGKAFISDRGGGYRECDLTDASKTFSREAERLATEAGIQFDGRDMFVADVALDRADTAMAILASCSAQAAAVAVTRSADRDERLAKEALFDRLNNVFGKSGFEKDAKLIGASNHQWHVDAVVKGSNGITVYNSVTRQYTSAAGTAAKFFDLARLETAPYRVAVVRSRVEMSDWFGVISAASNAVIELTAANDQFLIRDKMA